MGEQQPSDRAQQYGPSPREWVRDQVAEYEATGGKANTPPGHDQPIVVLTMTGHRSGMIRKVPVMRVEHEGEYAVVASLGGAPTNPVWVKNLMASSEIELQDGDAAVPATVRLLDDGPERDAWWERSVTAFPPYAQYQLKTRRQIPVFIATLR